MNYTDSLQPLYVLQLLLSKLQRMQIVIFLINMINFFQSCEHLIKGIKRLGDYEFFYSCDQEKCFKYFESEAKYNTHLEQHIN